MKLDGIYCCGCGANTPCKWEDLNLGKLFRCEHCGEVRVSILTRSGQKVWITVRPDQVEFYDVMKKAGRR